MRDERYSKKEIKENSSGVEGDSFNYEEDATDYGEFITSYFAWVPLPLQKEKAEEMENMTKKEKKRGNERK